MSGTVKAFIALGSNLGDREGYLAFARGKLTEQEGVTIMALSGVDETEPLGGLDQPLYLNQMVLVQTGLEARKLLSICHDVERLAGRRRSTTWGSRTLDLDLVVYGTMICDLPDLVLPHPGLRNRPFWASEIARLEVYG
jgi:2-amino-4-hydroxy-6-hydroxymethyldihydropteridine diphosphokinase